METDKIYKRSRFGKILGGMVIITVGIILLFKQLGTEFPEWLFTWQTGLIVFGVFIGAKHGFRNPGWIILVIVGSLFLTEYIFPGTNISQFIWPAVIITIGLFMVFSPHRHHHRLHKWHRMHRWRNEEWRKHMEDHWKKHEHGYGQYYQHETTSEDDRIDSTTVFGGVKKSILSKDFKGGDITALFGGAEINLSQADINEKAVLDVTAVFGGVKLIVPPHWKIKSEMTAILGGIEDKRPLQESKDNPEKILVLQGTAVCGGIEIRSY